MGPHDNYEEYVLRTDLNSRYVLLFFKHSQITLWRLIPSPDKNYIHIYNQFALVGRHLGIMVRKHFKLERLQFVCELHQLLDVCSRVGYPF